MIPMCLLPSSHHHCLWWLLLLVVLTADIFHFSEGTVYYVAPTTPAHGNAQDDSGAGYGVSTTQPFATLAYAADLAQPGDELVLMDGTYVNSDYQNGDIWKTGNTFWIRGLTGTADNPIVIRGQSNARGAILKGDKTAIFQCRSCSYVIIKWLHVLGDVQDIPLQEAIDNRFMYQLKNGDGTIYQRMDPSWTPAQIDAWFDAGNSLPLISTFRPTKYNTVGLLIHSSWQVTVEECEIGYVPATGLRAQNCDYLTFKNNIVHNSSRRSSLGTNGIVGNSGRNSISGSYVEDHGYRFIMWGNLIYNNYNEVYSWVDTKTYVHPYLDEGKGMSMEHLNNGNDWISGRCLMANNVAYNNGFSGVNTNNSNRVDLFHNTVYQNILSGTGNNAGISCNDSVDCKIKNNLAISINDFNGRAINSRFDDLSEIDITDNLYVGTLKAAMPINTGTQISSVDQFNFVDVNNHDFRLQAGSVAINACTNDVLVGLTLPGITVNSYTDYDGAARSAPADCGAFEFQVAGNPMPSAVPSMLPSQAPSDVPSMLPSQAPSRAPSDAPSKSSIPSMVPSRVPSSVPSMLPSQLPSSEPTLSSMPSSQPTPSPTNPPTPSPTLACCATEMWGDFLERLRCPAHAHQACACPGVECCVVCMSTFGVRRSMLRRGLQSI